MLSFAALKQLEEAAWEDASLRDLYATAHIPGFPWYFTLQTTPPNSPEPAIASTIASSSPCSVVYRHVVPYDYTFKVFAKGRWIGKTVLSVYSEELAHHSKAYYEACRVKGRLRLITKASLQQHCAGATASRRKVKRTTRQDGSELPSTSNLPSSSESELTLPTVSSSDFCTNYLLQHGDLVVHTVHRHEIPLCLPWSGDGCPRLEVISVRIALYGLIAVHKPGGVPTHATGRYFYNSAVSMMEYVCAPRRVHAWVVEQDPLLQSLVSTSHLTAEERNELLQYYQTEDASEVMLHTLSTEVSLHKAPRPCHRLDRVTSGVLLLGVSREAAGRVSVALMNKTKEMTSTVEKVVLSSHHESSLAELISRNSFGIYKRYIAFVHGKWDVESVCLSPSSSPQPLKVAEKDLRRLNAVSQSMWAAARHSNAGELISGESETDFPKGFLLRESNEKRQRDQEGQVANREEFVSLSAPPLCEVTLVQRLHAGSPASPMAALLCIPFTGRLHQIRRHLSAHGGCIVGDTEYGDRSSLPNSAVDQTKKAMYFDRELVPLWYKNNILVPYEQTNSSTAAEEPLCYECAQLLPLAVIPDGSKGGGIGLHAWGYSIEESVISENGATLSSEKDIPESRWVHFVTPKLPAWVPK